MRMAAIRAVGRAEGALAAAALLAVALIVFPWPTAVLDVLLALNLGLALIVLLAALGARSATELSAFPTILLLTTLARLALNVSTTRLILSEADAGQVVAAFGNAVVAGNVIVGAAIFAVITIVQYLVIARGAERVAQVGARFALDGLPGRQLAIDADLRAGLLDAEAARARREALARESAVFGSMDGAMKFVKGDALAGLCIVAVNVLGGLAIGVLQRGMSPMDAIGTYTVLTVGDGIVAQLPAVLTAIAAALVVTRVADPEAPGLAAAIARQLGRGPAFAFAGGLLCLLGLLPGLPALPLVGVGLVLALSSLWLASPEGPARRVARISEAPALAISLHPDATRLAPIDALRRQLEARFAEAGVSPALHLDPQARDLAPGQWRVEAGGAALALGEALETRALADRAMTVWRAHPRALLGVQAVADALAKVEARAPALLRLVVPRRADLGRLTELLQALLREGLSVADLRGALEVLATAPAGGTLEAQLSSLRAGLAPAITQRISHLGKVQVVVVDPELESELRRPGEPGLELSDELVESLRAQLQTHPHAAWMVAPDIRLRARRVIEAELPGLAVISAQELLAGVPVEVVGTLG